MPTTRHLNEKIRWHFFFAPAKHPQALWLGKIIFECKTNALAAAAAAVSLYNNLLSGTSVNIVCIRFCARMLLVMQMTKGVIFSELLNILNSSIYPGFFFTHDHSINAHFRFSINFFSIRFLFIWFNKKFFHFEICLPNSTDKNWLIRTQWNDFMKLTYILCDFRLRFDNINCVR